LRICNQSGGNGPVRGGLPRSAFHKSSGVLMEQIGLEERRWGEFSRRLPDKAGKSFGLMEGEGGMFELEGLNARQTEGRITRRDLLRRSAQIGVASSALGVLLDRTPRQAWAARSSGKLVFAA